MLSSLTEWITVLPWLQVVDSVQRLGSIEGMFELVDSKQDIGNFVQSHNADRYSAPTTSFVKPDDQPSSLVRPKTLTSGRVNANFCVHSTHKNLAVRKIVEAMRTSYAQNGTWFAHVPNYTWGKRSRKVREYCERKVVFSVVRSHVTASAHEQALPGWRHGARAKEKVCGPQEESKYSSSLIAERPTKVIILTLQAPYQTCKESMVALKQDFAEIYVFDVTSVGQRKYVFDVTSVGQRKYVFDVTSVGQRKYVFDVTSVGQRKYVFDVTSVGQPKHVFDVTSIGQRFSPWPCKLNERHDEISPRVQAPFSGCAVYVAAIAVS